MNITASLILLPLMVVTSVQENDVQVVGPDRVQEFHACVGTTAYIPWPLNVISRTGHRSTIITLLFQRRHSERKTVVATFNGRKELMALKPFRDRMTVSSEHSGIFLEKITFDDAGTYIAQARMSNGQMWTRTTNLTVHMRPIVHGGRLNMTQSEVTVRPNKRTHCVNITCGLLEYAGYPPAKYVWTAMKQTILVKTATDDSATSVQLCSPFFGDVTCSIAGYSSVCTYDHVVTLHLDLPGPAANSSSVTRANVTRDLVLKIIMPILAVGIPLAILGIWVLSHLLKSYPQFRERRHYQNREPQADADGDVEDNVTTEQTHMQNNDDNSDIIIEEDEHTEIKEPLPDSDDEFTPANHTNHNPGHENHLENHRAQVLASESGGGGGGGGGGIGGGLDDGGGGGIDNPTEHHESEEEDGEVEDDDEDAEDDSDEEEEDEDIKLSEQRPLMEDSLNNNSNNRMTSDV